MYGLTEAELFEVSGGQGGSQQVCQGVAAVGGYAVSQATGNLAAGVIFGLAINEACVSALNGGRRYRRFGNGSADATAEVGKLAVMARNWLLVVGAASLAAPAYAQGDLPL